MDDGLVNWLFVFLRASALLLVLPIFSTPNIPRQVRVALAACMGLLIAPGLPPFPLHPPSVAAWVGVFAMEVVSGLVMGFVTRMVFYVADFAGRLISNEMGLNLASVLNPLGGDQTQAPGLIVFYFSAVVLMTMDMHHWVLVGFQQTYTLLPIGGLHLREVLLNNMVTHTSRVFTVGVQMAAPLIATSFIVMLVFSILGRALPQMSVFGESFAIRVLVGLVVFGWTMETMALHLLNLLRRLPEDMMRVAQYLGTS